MRNADLCAGKAPSNDTGQSAKTQTAVKPFYPGFTAVFRLSTIFRGSFNFVQEAL